MVSQTGVKNVYKAHMLYEQAMKQSSGKSLAKVIDKEKNLNFKLYAFVPTGFHKVPNI